MARDRCLLNVRLHRWALSLQRFRDRGAGCKWTATLLSERRPNRAACKMGGRAAWVRTHEGERDQA
jgi:hypothetical protein